MLSFKLLHVNNNSEAVKHKQSYSINNATEKYIFYSGALPGLLDLAFMYMPGKPPQPPPTPLPDGYSATQAPCWGLRGEDDPGRKGHSLESRADGVTSISLVAW